MELLKNFDKAFENKVRLGIMSALMVSSTLEFTHLKELLNVTDGNLASHMKILEQKGFVSFTKEFFGRKPKTKYMATTRGTTAFKKHLSALEELIK